jgi:hypothetical protein
MHISDVWTTLKLFDAVVSPVLSYGCELWVESDTAELEVIHKGFVKSVLGLNKSTGTHLVMAEVGRFPLDVFWHKMALSYLVRLREATDLPVLQAAYHEQQQLTLANNDCWLFALNCWADNIGVDLNPEHLELAAGVSKIQNTFLQSVPDNSCIRFYSKFCEAYGYNNYLSNVENVTLRRALTRFRCSNYDLEVERGRIGRMRIEEANRICKCCSLNVIEDGEHFLMVCPALAATREEFSAALPLTEGATFSELMHVRNQSALARLIVEGTKARALMLESATEIFSGVTAEG